MKHASIDIGTNTLRLLIADVDLTGALTPLVYRRAITRLGGGYTVENGIHQEAAARTFAALREFKNVIDDVGVDSVQAVATSVVRRAVNSEWLLKEVEKRTGIKISIISGDEEARLSLLGVLSVLHDQSHRRLVMDIGGGSTEFIATQGGSVSGAWSMEMGVVHLTERHLKTDPPTQSEINELEGEIRGVIADVKRRMIEAGVQPDMYGTAGKAVFVGTAGTITTLAAIDQGLEKYDRLKINNYTLPMSRVRRIYEYLLGLTLNERHVVLSLEKGREDLIVPGCAIAVLAMEAFGFDSLKVSDAGLLEGVILKKTGIGARVA